MECYDTFLILLKRMNNKKIDWDKKNSWEYDIENSINNNKFIKYINNCLCDPPPVYNNDYESLKQV